MTPALLIRWSGVGPMVAGLLFALFPLLHPNHDAVGYQSAIWVPAHLMPNLGALLMLFGATLNWWLQQRRSEHVPAPQEDEQQPPPLAHVDRLA